MIKPAEMRRIRAIVLDDYLDDVVRGLEETGCVHLIDIKDTLDEWEQIVEPSKAGAELRECSELESRFNDVIKALPTEKEGSEGFLSRYIRTEEIERIPVEEKSLDEIESEFKDIEDVVLRTSDRINELEESLDSARYTYENLKTLDSLGIDLDIIGDFDFSFVLTGELPSHNIEELRSSIEDIEEHVLLERDLNERKFVVIASLKEHKEDVERLLRTLDFEGFVPPEDLPDKTKEALRIVEERINKYVEERDKLREKLDSLSKENRSYLLALRELVQIKESRENVKSNLGKTERVHTIEGWTPKKDVEEVSKKIRETSDENCYIEIKNPDGNPDAIPTLLENPKIIKPFESITRMFGIPRYNEVDPTIITAIIYPIFFGLMFPDVGHGLILLTLGLLLAYSFKGLGGGARILGRVIIFCSIGAIVFGFLFGEFFGFSEHAAHMLHEAVGVTSPVPLKPLWFEPIAEVVFFFALTIIIGYMHMIMGLIMNITKSVLDKEDFITPSLQLWCISGVFFFLLWPFGYLPGKMLLKFAPLMIAGPIVGILIWHVFRERHEMKEATSIIDKALVPISAVVDSVFETFFRYLANTISYGRILAMALCHAVLMEMVLLIAFGMYKILSGVIGLALWVIVFAIGTVIVIALELLIVNIQDVRLHFYEWFDKFYEGGGTDFKPFKIARKYTY